MAESMMNATCSTNENEANAPNHMIIWLDKHIGKPEECVLLKSSFFLTTDPTTSLFERDLNQDDIDRSICLEVALLVRLDKVEFVFQAFNDIEKCYKTIENNLHKRIFFITSGSIGKIIVPSLVKLHPETFPTDNPIFIFCANLSMVPVEGIEPTNLWLCEFLDNVLAYDHQDVLLARMTTEIADYFAEKSGLLRNQQPAEARQYEDWSQRMRRRHAELKRRINT